MHHMNHHHHHPHTLIADFTTQLISFAMPMFLSHLLQIVYNMADMIIVGQTLGKVGLSAISVGGDIMNCMTFIAMGFSSAGQVLIAQYIGAKQHEKLSRFVATMSAALFGFACCVTGIGLLFRREIMELMHTPPEAFAEALSYAGISMAGIVFVYGYNAVSAILRGMGDAKHPFYFISLAALLNIVLDVIFVMQLGTGAKGAALATILSQGVSFLLCAGFICKNRERYHLSLTFGQFFRPEKEMLLSLLKLGVPMAIKNAAVQFSKMFVNSWVNSFGRCGQQDQHVCQYDVQFCEHGRGVHGGTEHRRSAVRQGAADRVCGVPHHACSGCGCFPRHLFLPGTGLRYFYGRPGGHRSFRLAMNIFPLRFWHFSAARDEAAATR